MNNSESGNGGKIFGALLLGAAIGAGLGILLAPDKGSATRKKIFNTAKDVADKLKDRVTKQMEEFTNFEDPEKNEPV